MRVLTHAPGQLTRDPPLSASAASCAPQRGFVRPARPLRNREHHLHGAEAAFLGLPCVSGV